MPYCILRSAVRHGDAVRYGYSLRMPTFYLTLPMFASHIVCAFQVTSSHYDQATATQMNDNRQKREEEVGRLLTTLDATAITSSHLEYICGYGCAEQRA